MQEHEEEEDIVTLFRDFGAQDSNDVITVGGLDKALKDGGEHLNDEDL